MSGKYILNEEREAILCSDLMEWGRWFETADRHVANDMIGPARVSTVFLGLDHNHFGGVPLLFETMVFGNGLEEYQERCSTWDQAIEQHKVACDWVRRNLLQ